MFTLWSILATVYLHISDLFFNTSGLSLNIARFFTNMTRKSINKMELEVEKDGRIE